MRQVLVFVVLRTAKILGLFRLARRLTARDLRILCYHGAALDDEHRFRPGLFMTGATFANRMQFLADQHYPVIGLDEALEHLRDGTLPRCAIVITIDDGWYGTYRHMAPVLSRHRFPATLYIASYYLQKQTQVFNVAADFVLWRAGDRRLDLAKISERLHGSYDLADERERDEAARKLNGLAAALDGA